MSFWSAGGRELCVIRSLLFRRRFLLIGAYLLWSLRYGLESGPNPWGSRGYEWFSGSPPAPHNYTEPPRFEREVHDYTHPEAPRVY